MGRQKQIWVEVRFELDTAFTLKHGIYTNEIYYSRQTLNYKLSKIILEILGTMAGTLKDKNAMGLLQNKRIIIYAR